MQKSAVVVKRPLGTSGASAAEAWTGLAALAVLVAGGSLQALAHGLETVGSAGHVRPLGLMLLLAGLAWARDWSRHWREAKSLARFSLAAFALLTLFLIVSQRLARVDGRLVAWLEDDALVSMQYARHWAEGHGLVWTRGERVEGFSNPLWTLLMTGACALLPRDLAPLLILGLNLLLGLLGLLALRRLALALGATALAAALAMAGLGLSFELIWAGLSGMESVALAALTAVAMADVAEARAAGRAVPTRALILAGVLGVLRFDGLLPGLIVLGLAWVGLEGGRRWRALGWVLAPALAWLAFRLHYYGDWLPTPVRLKSGAWPGRWERGILYVLRVFYHAKMAWAFGLLAWIHRPLRPWALALALLLGYGTLTGGDFYPGTRYLAGAWPLLWALPAAALSRLLRPAWSTAGMTAAVLLSAHAFWEFPHLLQGGWAESRDRIRAAAVLDQVVQPGQRVAAAWAGSFFYYSSVQGVDLLGKCDPVVARAAAEPAVTTPGHNKLNLEHSLGHLRPEWVLLIPPGLPDKDAWLHAVYDAKIAGHPLFRAHCRPAGESLPDPWVLFRCRWP